MSVSDLFEFNEKELEVKVKVGSGEDDTTGLIVGVTVGAASALFVGLFFFCL